MIQSTLSFSFTSPRLVVSRTHSSLVAKSVYKTSLFMADTKENEVVELVDNDDESTSSIAAAESNNDKTTVAPFLSQGEISEEAMQMDWKDPKQARVMFYIILSLLPVLFLIPLMLGSRDLIPVDALPPVPLN